MNAVELTDAQGNVLNKPTVALTAADATLLRAYRQFLQRHGLREALFCEKCWDRRTVHDGTRAHVTANEIVIECRCARRLFQGMTF